VQQRGGKGCGDTLRLAAGLFIVGAEDASRADLDIHKVIKKEKVLIDLDFAIPWAF
jgi:hypothetical protein